MFFTTFRWQPVFIFFWSKEIFRTMNLERSTGRRCETQKRFERTRSSLDDETTVLKLIKDIALNSWSTGFDRVMVAKSKKETDDRMGICDEPTAILIGAEQRASRRQLNTEGAEWRSSRPFSLYPSMTNFIRNQSKIEICSERKQQQNRRCDRSMEKNKDAFMASRGSISRL